MLLVPSNCSRLLSTLGICTESVITGAAFRTADQLSIGIASSSGRPHPSWWPARHLHGSVQAGQAYKTARDAEQDDDDEPQTKREHRFVSLEHQKPTGPPKRWRHPIFFPDVTLEMMKLSDEQLKEIKETGWTREVAFKTHPNVTKMEIKAYIESVYGMEVERVQTINYLGKLREVPSQIPGSKKHGNMSRPKLYREDDWKKAYVTFVPPEGVTLPSPPRPAPPLEMLQALRDVHLRGVSPAKTARQAAYEAKLIRPADVLQEIEQEAQGGEGENEGSAAEKGSDGSGSGPGAAGGSAQGVKDGDVDGAKLGVPEGGPAAPEAGKEGGGSGGKGAGQDKQA